MAKEKVVPPVNCANDAQMIAEGLRQPILAVDRDCFKKTDEESQKAKEAKLAYNKAQREKVVLSIEEIN